LVNYQVWNEDCTLGMRRLVPNNSIDLIFTDPPYGIDGAELHTHYVREQTNIVPGYVDVPLDQYAQFSMDWIRECDRCLRPGGSLYIVSGYTNLHHVLNALHATSLQEVNHLIAQYTFGVSTTKKWVSSHYHMLFWEKPSKGKQTRTFNSYCRFAENKDSYHDRTSVQDMPRDLSEATAAAPKNENKLSEEFVEKYILYSSNRGDLVMDPFCGGFSTARCALKYGRRFVGFELNPNAYQAFSPGLATVDVLDDPLPVEALPEDKASREHLREVWKRTRANRKHPDVGLW
jgi:site-specific DNA-methyltransferase (adenine-specific)